MDLLQISFLIIAAWEHVYHLLWLQAVCLTSAGTDTFAHACPIGQRNEQHHDTEWHKVLHVC